jgi:hypothetical protein
VRSYLAAGIAIDIRGRRLLDGYGNANGAVMAGLRKTYRIGCCDCDRTVPVRLLLYTKRECRIQLPAGTRWLSEPCAFGREWLLRCPTCEEQQTHHRAPEVAVPQYPDPLDTPVTQLDLGPRVLRLVETMTCCWMKETPTVRELLVQLSDDRIGHHTCGFGVGAAAEVSRALAELGVIWPEKTHGPKSR